jgi:hypothetical protein
MKAACSEGRPIVRFSIAGIEWFSLWYDLFMPQLFYQIQVTLLNSPFRRGHTIQGWGKVPI